MNKKLMLTIAGLAVLGGGLYLYYKRQFKLLQDYTYRITKFKINKFSFKEIACEVNIQFTSKADIEAKIEKIYLDLFIEDKNVGFLTETKSFIIPAKGSSDIPLFISINPQFILKNITDIILGAGAKKDVKFKMDGYADISSGFIKTTLPIKYETTLKEYLPVKR